MPQFPESPKIDKIFNSPSYPKKFRFDANVAQVFDDMVSRSVPDYHHVQSTCVKWAHEFYQPGTQIYDIGCSTGTTMAAILSEASRSTRVTGIDNSPSMIDKAHDKLAPFQGHHKIDLIAKDALHISYAPASFVILNYSLQFVPVKQRETLMRKLTDALVPGGVLFLSEKVRAPIPEIQEMITSEYETFKSNNGYSRTEIERKKEALEQVLIPYTIAEHEALLTRVGLSRPEIILKWNSFCTMVSVKPS